MKRTTALVLAILLLMSWTAAPADSFGTRFDISKIRISLLNSSNDTVAKLHGIKLAIQAGSAEGVPTLQASLLYGGGQQLDAVVQMVGNRLYLCVGGINGTFYVDLNDLLGEGQNKLVSAAVGSALLMVGKNPQSVLQMLMKEDEKGRYSATVKIPAEQYRTFAQPVIDVLAGTGALSDDERQTLQNILGESKRSVKLKLFYNPDTGWFRIRVSRGKKGYKLNFKMNMTTEPMEFINIRADEVQYNLLNLDQEVVDEMRVEMDFLGFKADSFAENNDINKLTENPEK